MYCSLNLLRKDSTNFKKIHVDKFVNIIKSWGLHAEVCYRFAHVWYLGTDKKMWIAYLKIVLRVWESHITIIAFAWSQVIKYDCYNIYYILAIWSSFKRSGYFRNVCTENSFCLHTKTVWYVSSMCIIIQRDNALQDFVNDFMPFKRYNNEPSAPHRF